MQGTLLQQQRPLAARRHHAGVAPRSALRMAPIRASSEVYVPPSSRPASTELSSLERYSEVVPDVLLSQALQSLEAPKAATVSRAVLGGILGSPTMRPSYKIAIEQAKYFDRCKALPGSERTACQIDKALVNLGALFLEKVEGRVSTEVDPRVANDTAKLVARGRNLIDLYEEVGVPRNRVLLRIPATWEGIQAAQQLEQEGITTHLVLVYSFVQGAAAAQAGVSVIQPNVGRLHDWYNRHPGYIRDPKGGTQESYYGKVDETNPGLLLVENLYNFVKRGHFKSLIMASGIRTKQEALALAGCDYLVIGPRVLEALGRSTTLEGYNDGLSAASGVEDAVQARLTPARAKDADFTPDELAPVTEKSFRSGLGKPAEDLMAEGLKRLVEDAERLEPYFIGLAGGQT